MVTCSASASEATALWHSTKCIIIIIIYPGSMDLGVLNQELKTRLAGTALVQFGEDQKRPLESNETITLDRWKRCVVLRRPPETLVNLRPSLERNEIIIGVTYGGTGGTRTPHFLGV